MSTHNWHVGEKGKSYPKNNVNRCVLKAAERRKDGEKKVNGKITVIISMEDEVPHSKKFPQCFHIQFTETNTNREREERIYFIHLNCLY